jgi:hypothetical protein
MENITAIKDWIDHQYFSILVGFCSAIVTILAINSLRGLTKPQERQPPMSAKARKRFVRAHLANIFTLVIEESRFKGKLTDEECAEIYQQLGSRLHLKDVLPRGPWTNWRPDTDVLKEAIKKRLGKVDRVFDPMSIRKI